MGDSAMIVGLKRGLAVVCICLGCLSTLTVRAGDILTSIPADALAFAVVHDLAATNESVNGVAKLLHAPEPNLLGMMKLFGGGAQGIDEHGDLAVIVTSIDPKPQGVLLVPVADFAAFFTSLHLEEPKSGAVEYQLSNNPLLVARKGNFAVVAQAKDREAMDKYLASTTSLEAEASLPEWLSANRVSIIVPSGGLKQLLPKAMAGIQELQANFRKIGGAQGDQAAAAFDMYLQLFTVAQQEIDQLAVAVRINSAQTVELVKRALFTPNGSWAKMAAEIEPVTNDLLAGLPAEPLVFAGGGIVPQGAMGQLMKFSVEFMKKPPYNLTAEQAKQYGDLSTQSMQGVRSMSMLIGVAPEGTGFYGNSTGVIGVDNAQQFIDNYETALGAMRQMAEEVKSPGIPVSTVKRTTIGDIEALEVSMDFAHMKSVPGGPDPQQMMKVMMGPSGKMTIFIAPADEQTVIMAYTSPERLQSAIYFYNSKQPGLSDEAGVAEVAAALPDGAQMIGYFSLRGAMSAMQQLMAAVPGAPVGMFPEFPPGPPVGMAAKMSSAGVESHVVVTAGTLRSLGEMVEKGWRKAPAGGPPAR